MPDPRLPLTVKRELWNEMAGATYPEFADSYLSGAVQTVSTLIPHTVTAFERLNKNIHAMACLHRMGLRLVPPLPFGHPERPDSHHRIAAE